MAACIVEDASTTTSIYCQTTNTMERTPSTSLETTTTTTTNKSEHHRCTFNIQIDSKFKINQESTMRKRQLSQNETKTITDHSCRSQAVSINKTTESM
jgi:hypothetical protein